MKNKVMDGKIINNKVLEK